MKTGGSLAVCDLPQDHLCAKSASELAGLLLARDLSAEELLLAHVERIEAVNLSVNALVTLDIEYAIKRARELDDMAAKNRFSGPLHGLPVAIKDIFPTVGLRTTFGSRVFAEHVPQKDAIHVARIRAAGAIIIAKTNTAEFAFGAQTTNPLFGVTRNPFDLDKTVSGSSGGAAAALASGLCVLADGSDLGGSIRAPASFTGVVGLRPTSRIIPLAGTSLPFDGLNVPGPMARTAADARKFLKVMAGPALADPLSQGVAMDWGKPPISNLGELRLAWCLTPGNASIHPDIANVLTSVRATLETFGAKLEEAEPEDLKDMVRAQQTFRDWTARLELGEIARDKKDLFGPEIVRTLQRAASLTVKDLERAEKTRLTAWAHMQAFWEKFDFCIWPTNCQLAYGADADTSKLNLDETPILSTPALGVPALTIPVGKTPDGIPVGLQLIGPRYSDLDLLEFGQILIGNLGKSHRPKI